MAVKCTNCGGSHPAWDCTKPQTKSTAERKDVPVSKVSGEAILDRSTPEGIQALPVDTKIDAKKFASWMLETHPSLLAELKRLEGQPSKAQFNKAAYQKDYMRDLRKAKPLGMRVKEWRKRNDAS